MRQAAAPAGSADRAELSVRIRGFPLDRNGDPIVVYPTRLGNLIRASESYPELKYGIDGVFGWYRLWVSIDKDLRAELDDQQSLVDSCLYGSVVLLAGAAIGTIYFVLKFVDSKALPLLPGWITLGVAIVGALILSRILYMLSLFTQASYGELFAALFDQYRETLKLGNVADVLADRNGDPALRGEPETVRNRAAIRFLRWHKYRRVGARKNRGVRGW